MSRYANIIEMTDDDWNWHFDIVLRHAFLAMQHAGRSMEKTGGGMMVFVASVSGITSAPRHAAYGAAKAGLMSLVRTGAVEMGPHNIRVNAVAPGVVWTPRVSEFLGDDGASATSSTRHCVASRSRPTSPPRSCSCRPTSPAYVTGQTLTVDGGVGAKFPYPMADL